MFLKNSSDPEKVDLHISEREFEILDLISYGHSTRDIAQYLFISSETVKSHRKNLFNKIGATNVANLVRRSFEHGIIC